MKRVALSLVLVAGLAATSAMAADMATKAPPAPPPPPSPWDVAITAALMTDYNFRGITQSAHNPSTQAGFELRYTQSPMWQYYAGISGESIDFPNQRRGGDRLLRRYPPDLRQARAGFRRLVLLVSGRQLLRRADVRAQAIARRVAGGVVPIRMRGVWQRQRSRRRTRASGKSTARRPTRSTINGPPGSRNITRHQWPIQAPGAGTSTGNLTFTAPSTWFPANSGIGGYISGDIGYWDLGTSGIFYGTDNPAVRLPEIRSSTASKYTSYYDLGRRVRLDLQGVHARSALLRHQPDHG